MISSSLLKTRSLEVVARTVVNPGQADRVAVADQTVRADKVAAADQRAPADKGADKAAYLARWGEMNEIVHAHLPGVPLVHLPTPPPQIRAIRKTM